MTPSGNDAGLLPNSRIYLCQTEDGPARIQRLFDGEPSVTHAERVASEVA